MGEMIYSSELEKVPAVQLQDVAFACLQSIPQAVSLNAVCVLQVSKKRPIVLLAHKTIDLLL